MASSPSGSVVTLTANPSLDRTLTLPGPLERGAVAPLGVAATGVELQAPHGGILGFFAMSGIWMFIVALLVGTPAGATAVVVAKSIGRPKAEATPEDAVDLAHAHIPSHAGQPATA